jgi:hypothetical protein
MTGCCLEIDIINLDNFKNVIKASLTLKHDYSNNCIKHGIEKVPDHSEFAINSMIGMFKNNLNKNESWKSISFTPNSCDAFNSYLNYNESFIEVKHIGEKKYHHTFERKLKLISTLNRLFKTRLLINSKLNYIT